jgi:hypothetical protein
MVVPSEALLEETKTLYGFRWQPLHILAGIDERVLNQIPRPVKILWRKFFIELHMIRQEALTAEQRIPGYMGFAYHFRELVDVVWGDEDWLHYIKWNPYIDQMIDKALKYKYLGVAGHASASKSCLATLWAIVNFIAYPDRTKVFITSTSLIDSRGRIWGAVERYWNRLLAFFGGIEEMLPGELISSTGTIRGRLNGVKDDLCGIALIAASKGNEKDAAKKIGFKNLRIIFIGDELPLLSEEIINSAKGNLASNPFFQFIGIGNPTSQFDPFGQFTEPLDGWSSIDEHSTGWRTKLGYCLRFDGATSPNVTAKKNGDPSNPYKGLLHWEEYEESKVKLGENSFEFWKQYRGFYSPTGRTDSIFWEADFETYHARRKVLQRIGIWTPVASLDPAFSHDGDRAVATFGEIGDALLSDGTTRRVLEFTEQIDYTPRLDRNKNKSAEVIRLFAADLRQRNIPPQNVSVDGSGGGDPFAGWLATEIGQGVLLVQFGGAPSDLPVSLTDSRKGSDRFLNKVTEMWVVMRDLLRSQQLAGLGGGFGADVMRELCARDYKTHSKGKLVVEDKATMKKRTGGTSPDRADSLVLLSDLCRQRFGLASKERPKKIAKPVKRDPYGDVIEKPDPMKPRFKSLKSYAGIGWGRKKDVDRMQRFQ